MSVYLLINILILLIPLILSFENKLKYYKNFPAVLISILTTGFVYIVWDIAATAQEDWSFNQNYVSGLKVFNLPFEELLFFITVPYACLFIYESVSYYLNDRRLQINDNYFYGAAVIFLVLSLLFVEQNYTFTVFLLCGSYFILATNFSKSLLVSSNYWITILITFIPFFIVNYFLASLPVVNYNSQSFSGIRIITIPLEDFFYSFSMLSFNIFSYSLAKEFMKEKETELTAA